MSKPPPDIDIAVLVDLAENAMQNVHDMDVTFRQYAEAAVEAVLKELYNDKR